MQITISDIPIEVTKKKVKNLRISVVPPDGRVRVSAPMRMSNAVIITFVRSKLDWIQKHREKARWQPKSVARCYVSGETLYVWGERYTLEVVYGRKRNSLELIGDKAFLTVREESTAEQRGAFVKEWYRAQLKSAVAEYLPKWEKLTGLYSSSWQSKDMKTRWGTCNTAARRIWLNVQLAKKPRECLEYVILHELAHLEVHDHGPRFKALLDRYMPDWRERKKLLNESP